MYSHNISQIDESELRNEFTLMLNNLIEGIIRSIDFNNFKLVQFQHYIMYNIEDESPGITQKLIDHLKNEENYSIEEIVSFANKSTIKTWPTSFKSDLINAYSPSAKSLKFKQLFYYFDEKKSERKHCLEMKECCIHHLKRPFECHSDRNTLYHAVRFACCCCWTSYIWRLICRPILNKNDCSDLCYCLCEIACFPCWCCYLCDRLNYEPQKIIQYGQSIFDFRPVVQIITKQPTPFHYTKQYFDSFFYLAIEVSNQLNEKFVIWLKIPYNYHHQFDMHDTDNI